MSRNRRKQPRTFQYPIGLPEKNAVRFNAWMTHSRSPMRQEVQSIFLCKFLGDYLTVDCLDPACDVSKPHNHWLWYLVDLQNPDFWSSLESEGF